jgi:phosphoribosyl-ATP pyrophosphohydrolase
MWLQQRERGIICAERYLWGSGIYTDDSDPVAAAMHSGFIKSVNPPGIDEALLERLIEEQTPIIDGSLAPDKPQLIEEGRDLHITLVVLPQLECYVDSVRFGLKSRRWPSVEDATNSSSSNMDRTPHDGVSFMVLKAEFVDDGTETRRVGRTGVEKRARLHREMMERKAAFEKRRQKPAAADSKPRPKTQKPEHASDSNKASQSGKSDAETKKLPEAKSGATIDSSRRQGDAAQGKPRSTEDGSTKLDIGQSPGEWIRQLTVAAA